MKLPRWLTLKTSDTLYSEEQAAAVRTRVLNTPHGLRSFIDDKQKAVDEVKARTDGFLSDIENYFGAAAKYLTPAYTGRSKFGNIESGSKRRIGVKWLDRMYTFDDVMVTTVGFVYTETPSGVRVDFILKRISGPKNVINDNYDPDSDDIYKEQYNSVDGFRTVRRYDSHEAFAKSGDRPPQWFVDILSARKPTV